MADGDDPTGTGLLDLHLERADLAALDAWLAEADDGQRRAAAAWHRTHRAALEEHLDGESWELHRERRWASPMIIASCAPPAEAAKALPWDDGWFLQEEHRALLARALHRRPRAWAEAFVPAAGRVRLGRRNENGSAQVLFGLLDGLVRAHDLPLPDGDAFLQGWARSILADDPLVRSLYPVLLSSSHLCRRPDLPAVLEATVASGELDRADVVDAALGALVASLRPSAQRVLADLLGRLALTPEELAGRLPLLQSALATGHGSITAVLLPLAVSQATQAADLDQIAAVIAGRGEKRQRATLLDLLQDPDLGRRVGLDAVRRGLDHLESCDDAGLRERVARARRRLASETGEDTVPPEVEAPVEDGLWAPLARTGPPVVERLRVPDHLRQADIGRFLGEISSMDYAAQQGRINRIGHALLLECLVRAASDPAALRAWLPAHDHRTWMGLQPVPGAVLCWLRGDLDDGPVYDARIPGDFYGGATPTWRPGQLLVNAAAREALWRAGRVASVLSTPSEEDGTLRLHVLLRRIEGGWVPSYTPYDLVQALLRLKPVSPPDRARLEGVGELALPADAACWTQHADGRGHPGAASPDGVELIRRWVSGGGLRPTDVRWRLGRDPNGRLGWSRDDEPPFPVEVLDALLVDGAELVAAASVPTAVDLVPCWPDLLVSNLFTGRTDARFEAIVAGPGPLGTPGHAAVLLPLAGDPEQQRRGALGLLELAQRDVLSVEHAGDAVDQLNRAGMLPLARVALGLEQAFGAGGLADLWPVALGVTADAARRRPLPSGLPDLLRLLAAYLPSVPDRRLPVELVALATARGTTVSHAEARALVARSEVP